MTPCSIWIPPCANGPVLTVRRPSLNGLSCATAGAGKRVSAAAPAAVPAKTARRLTLRDISLRDIGILPFGADDYRGACDPVRPLRDRPLGHSFHVIIPGVPGEARPQYKVRYCRAFFNIPAAADSRASGADGRQSLAPARDFSCCTAPT